MEPNDEEILAKSRPRDVYIQMDRLSTATDELSDAIDKLEKRFIPFIRHIEEIEEIADEGDTTLCQFALRIRCKRHNIERNTRRILSILQRIEV
jgi:uncharacterized coiled-coil DUF342 family protein